MSLDKKYISKHLNIIESGLILGGSMILWWNSVDYYTNELDLAKSL